MDGRAGDDNREANGTAKDDTAGNSTRMGVKAYINGHNAIDNDKSREFQPPEANWSNTQPAA